MRGEMEEDAGGAATQPHSHTANHGVKWKDRYTA